MSENRPFRPRPSTARRNARRRLRALFLSRLARLVRLRIRLKTDDPRRRRFIDQAICSTVSDCNRLGRASEALVMLAKAERARLRAEGSPTTK